MILFSIQIFLFGCVQNSAHISEKILQKKTHCFWILVNLFNLVPFFGKWQQLASKSVIILFFYISRVNSWIRMIKMESWIEYTRLLPPFTFSGVHLNFAKLDWKSLKLFEKKTLWNYFFRSNFSPGSIFQAPRKISPSAARAIKVGLWDDSLGLFHYLCSHSKSSKF